MGSENTQKGGVKLKKKCRLISLIYNFNFETKSIVWSSLSEQWIFEYFYCVFLGFAYKIIEKPQTPFTIWTAPVYVSCWWYETRNPINFESQGQRSRSTFTFCLWKVFGMIQITVYPSLVLGMGWGQPWGKS